MSLFEQFDQPVAPGIQRYKKMELNHDSVTLSHINRIVNRFRPKYAGRPQEGMRDQKRKERKRLARIRRKLKTGASAATNQSGNQEAQSQRPPQSRMESVDDNWFQDDRGLQKQPRRQSIIPSQQRRQHLEDTDSDEDGNKSEGAKSRESIFSETEEEIMAIYDGILHCHPTACYGFTLGSGPDGELGAGATAKFHKEPKLISFQGSDLPPERMSILSVAAGINTCYILTREGAVYSWGDGEKGQLGLGIGTKRLARPAPIKYLVEKKVKVKHMAIGNRHAVVIDGNGAAISWGDGTEGQLGHGYREESDPYAYIPRAVEGLSGSLVVGVSCGDAHSIFLTCEENSKITDVYACGRNSDGQLGNGENEDKNRPTIIKKLSKKQIRTVHCGHSHSMAISHSGNVYSWGNALHGRLGHSHYHRMVNIPTTIDYFKKNDVKIRDISCADEHNVALDNKAQVWVWGNGNEGQLGLGPSVSLQIKPRRIDSLAQRNVVRVSARHQSSAAVTDTGWLYTWGRGDMGQLGHKERPVFSSRRGGDPMDVDPKGENVPKVVASAMTACVTTVAFGAHMALIAGTQLPPEDTFPLLVEYTKNWPKRKERELKTISKGLHNMEADLREYSRLSMGTAPQERRRRKGSDANSTQADGKRKASPKKRRQTSKESQGGLFSEARMEQTANLTTRFMKKMGTAMSQSDLKSLDPDEPVPSMLRKRSSGMLMRRIGSEPDLTEGSVFSESGTTHQATSIYSILSAKAAAMKLMKRRSLQFELGEKKKVAEDAMTFVKIDMGSFSKNDGGDREPLRSRPVSSNEDEEETNGQESSANEIDKEPAETKPEPENENTERKSSVASDSGKLEQSMHQKIHSQLDFRQVEEVDEENDDFNHDEFQAGLENKPQVILKLTPDHEEAPVVEKESVIVMASPTKLLEASPPPRKVYSGSHLVSGAPNVVPTLGQAISNIQSKLIIETRVQKRPVLTPWGRDSIEEPNTDACAPPKTARPAPRKERNIKTAAHPVRAMTSRPGPKPRTAAQPLRKVIAGPPPSTPRQRSQNEFLQHRHLTPLDKRSQNWFDSKARYSDRPVRSIQPPEKEYISPLLVPAIMLARSLEESGNQFEGNRHTRPPLPVGATRALLPMEKSPLFLDPNKKKAKSRRRKHKGGLK